MALVFVGGIKSFKLSQAQKLVAQNLIFWNYKKAFLLHNFPEKQNQVTEYQKN